MWNLAPGSKSSSVRGTGGHRPWYFNLTGKTGDLMVPPFRVLGAFFFFFFFEALAQLSKQNLVCRGHLMHFY